MKYVMQLHDAHLATRIAGAFLNLQKLHGEQLKKQVLWNALVATARKRGTLEQINSGDRREIFDEIEISSVMENLWKTYQKNYSYAADIS